MNLKLMPLIAISSVLSLATSAMANFTVVHKWTDSVSSKTYVYVPNVPTGTPVNGVTPRNPTLRVLTLNNCGIGKITKPSTSNILNIEGAGATAVNFSGKSSGTAPTCKTDSPGVYTSSWSGSVGSVLETPEAFFVKGGSGAGAINLNIVSEGKLTTKGNACGWVRITVSETRPMTNFSIGSNNYTLASVPAVTNPMVCRKVAGSSFTYVPQ